jgi:two-component system chemotaxis response regulator CheB
MSGHDIVVIGSSAGGIKALGSIVSNLPSDIDAAIFIVQHLAPSSPSFLPQILQDVGSLPAIHPADSEKIVKGKIYVAPPDFHLLIRKGYVSVCVDPKRTALDRQLTLCSVLPPGPMVRECWL